MLVQCKRFQTKFPKSLHWLLEVKRGCLNSVIENSEKGKAYKCSVISVNLMVRLGRMYEHNEILLSFSLVDVLIKNWYKNYQDHLKIYNKWLIIFIDYCEKFYDSHIFMHLCAYWCGL